MGVCARPAAGVLAAAAATVAMAVPASAQAPAPPPKNPGVGASSTVACGISYPARDSSGFHRFPANTVTLRSGPSNSCIQTGQGLPDQLAEYLCYTPGTGEPGRFCVMSPPETRVGCATTYSPATAARCPVKTIRHRHRFSARERRRRPRSAGKPQRVKATEPKGEGRCGLRLGESGVCAFDSWIAHR